MRAFRTWALAALLAAVPLAATAAERPSADTPILFTADEVIHDRNLGVVRARGHVEISQTDRILLADSVSYNERENILTASGNVSLLEPSGDVLFANYMELTGDLKNGIVQDLRVLLSDSARMAANGARRSDGNRLELSRAVYSPCTKCIDEIGETPFWRIKAIKIVHDQVAQTIEYTDAWLEIAGVPVAYTPYFSHPDPTVRRKSGFLAPTVGGSTVLGTSVSVPYFFNLAPNRDFTLTPTLTTKERAVIAGEYRQLGVNSLTETEASITYDSDDEFRGHVDSFGRLDVSDTWRAGYDLQRATDDTYTRIYNFGSQPVLTSRVYAEGFRKRNYAAIESYAFQGLRASDDPGATPLVLPMATYQHIGEPNRIGARSTLDASLVALTRTEGTDTRRLSLGGGWHLPYITRRGERYDASLTLHGDFYHVSSETIAGEPGEFTGVTGRVQPQAALSWRFPVSKQTGNISHVIEPSAAVIVSPYGGNPNKIPNEDSQEFEFDDTNLFAENRFPGYDRVEGGPRVNYGLKWGVIGRNGGSTSAFVGQSFRVRADDTFNEGSGLEDNFSDIVGRLSVSPGKLIDLGYRTRLDKDDFSPRRHELQLSAGSNILSVNTNYVFFDRQTGSEFPGREEISGSVNAQLSRHWRSSLSGRYNLEGDGDLRNIGLNFTYECECFEFGVSLTRSFYEDRDLKPADAIIFRLTFKTLGDVRTAITSSGGI